MNIELSGNKEYILTKSVIVIVFNDLKFRRLHRKKTDPRCIPQKSNCLPYYRTPIILSFLIVFIIFDNAINTVIYTIFVFSMY